MPQSEPDTTWSAIRAELRRTVTDLAFHLWLEPLEPAAIDGTSVYVRAPRHIRTLVEERYLPLLRAAAEHELGAGVTVQIVGQEWSPPDQGSLIPRRRHRGVEALNPKYTFDQFVIGDGNRLAHAAALAVAEQPAQAYNPLFLHGRPGLGKTHLLQAIGNYVQSFGGDLEVRYTTADEFTSAFVAATRPGADRDGFKAAFRNVDLLLIDDIQLLVDRVKTREEFFHTFNALYESGAQLVLSSDRSPAEMSDLELRLAERFASGLVASVEAPDVAVRHAILRKRAVIDDLADVPEDALLEVARHVDTSVRALEGALIRVVAYASLREEPATPELARRVLEQLYPRPARARITIADVQEQVATQFGIDRRDLVAQDRRPQVALARQVAMYIARELTKESLPAIGEQFGGRNHSTVLHAHRKVAGARRDDHALREAIGEVERRLGEVEPTASNETIHSPSTDA